MTKEFHAAFAADDVRLHYATESDGVHEVPGLSLSVEKGQTISIYEFPNASAYEVRGRLVVATTARLPVDEGVKKDAFEVGLALGVVLGVVATWLFLRWAVNRASWC